MRISNDGATYEDVLTGTAGGADILGSGTAGKLPKFTGAATIGDSILSDSGSAIRVTSADAVIEFDESDQVGAAGMWRLAAGAGALYVQENTSLGRNFASVSTPFYIASGGNVGIGTTNPDY